MSYYYNYNGGGLFSRIPKVSKNILIINVLMWLLTLVRRTWMVQTFSLFYPLSPLFHWWQPVTYMFMHGGWDHIFFNMFTFLMFGCTLERQWGPKKYLLFYFVTGLGAAALHIGVQALMYRMGSISQAELYNIPTLGASGAVYGILLGFAMLFPDAKMTLIFPPITLSSKWWVAIMLGIELFLGYTGLGGGVAHFAHLGGALFGFLLIRYWKRKGTMYQYEN